MRNILRATILGGCLALMTAQAEQGYESFKATNQIAAGTALTSWPTNVAGTNGLNRMTGGMIQVANQERASFVYRGEPIPTNTATPGTARFWLVRAYQKSPSIMSNAVNTSWAAFCDWETAPSLIFDVIPNGINSTTWSTNLDSYIQGGVAGVGILTMSNGLWVNMTNFDVGLAKKIVPPGNK